MKFIIWGCGKRGKWLLDFISAKRILAYIDTDFNKIGTNHKGIPILNYEEAIVRYPNELIVISMYNCEDVEEFLITNGKNNYLILNDCPAEFYAMIPGMICETIFTRISADRRKDSMIGLFGINLYSLLLEGFLIKAGFINIHLIKGIKNTDEFVDQLKNLNKFRIINENNIDKLDELLIAEYAPEKVFHIDCKKKIDIFDLTSLLEIYKNDLLKRFSGIHKGKRCFIVATGPSMQVSDLELLSSYNEYCISMNLIYKIFNQTFWRPNYYVVEDRKAIENFSNEIEDMSVETKFIADTFPPFWEKKHGGNIYRFHCPINIYFPYKPQFSSDVSTVAYWGSTVTYVCIQLALYMGFEKVYLLGVDHHYSNDISDNDHFIKDYYEKKSYNVYNKETAELAFQAARNHAEEHKVKIFNATRGGALEVFERVDFDSLF